MILFLYGEDFKKRQKKLKETTLTLKKKRSNSEVFFINESDFKIDWLEELIYSKGLFDEKHIVILSNIFKNKDAESFVIKNLKKISESSHIFILTEEFLKKDLVKKISKQCYSIEEFPLNKKETEESFNVFSFTDAVGKRDAWQAWRLLNIGLLKNEKVESFYRLTFWMIKGMSAAKKFDLAKDANMKPFPFNKAKTYSRNYSNQELENISTQLIKASLKNRRGESSLLCSLEKIIIDL